MNLHIHSMNSLSWFDTHEGCLEITLLDRVDMTTVARARQKITEDMT